MTTDRLFLAPSTAFLQYSYDSTVLCLSNTSATTIQSPTHCESVKGLRDPEAHQGQKTEAQINRTTLHDSADCFVASGCQLRYFKAPCWRGIATRWPQLGRCYTVRHMLANDQSESWKSCVNAMDCVVLLPRVQSSMSKIHRLCTFLVGFQHMRCNNSQVTRTGNPA